MIYVCGNCGHDVEVEMRLIYPGTSDPALVIEPFPCLKKEKVTWITEDLVEARNTIMEALDDLRRNL